MLRMRQMVPNVYYDHSRDFQLIGRLYELVANMVKTNADMLYNLPVSDDMNERLLDLAASTLGFKSLHHYNVNQLRALCSAFTEILRSKGAITSIEKACNTLVAAEGIAEEIGVEVDNDTRQVFIYVPPTLSDINLLKDVLIYILPAGMSYTIIRTHKNTYTVDTELVINTDKVNIYPRTGDDNNKYGDWPESWAAQPVDTALPTTTLDTYDNANPNHYPEYYKGTQFSMSVVDEYISEEELKADTKPPEDDNNYHN